MAYSLQHKLADLRSVLAQFGLNQDDLGVLNNIADHQNEVALAKLMAGTLTAHSMEWLTAFSWASIKLIGLECSMSISKVKHSLRKLSAGGFLVKYRGAGTKVYRRVNPTKLQEMIDAVPARKKEIKAIMRLAAHPDMNSIIPTENAEPNESLQPDPRYLEGSEEYAAVDEVDFDATSDDREFVKDDIQNDSEQGAPSFPVEPTAEMPPAQQLAVTFFNYQCRPAAFDNARTLESWTETFERLIAEVGLNDAGGSMHYLFEVDTFWPKILIRGNDPLGYFEAELKKQLLSKYHGWQTSERNAAKQQTKGNSHVGNNRSISGGKQPIDNSAAVAEAIRRATARTTSS